MALQNAFESSLFPPGSLWYARPSKRAAGEDLRRKGEREIEGHESHHSVTILLHRWSRGDEAAAEELAEIVKGQLLSLARKRLKGKGDGHTIGPFDLINEAWIKLTTSGKDKEWDDRYHFLRVAALAMQSILVDHARKKNRPKHKAPGKRVEIESILTSRWNKPIDALAFKEALERLQGLNSQMHEVVRYRFLSGYTVDETADLTGMSKRQVERCWTVARAWLKGQLE